MSIEVKRRYGTTLQHAAFTGAAHEITVDTDKNTAVVHDGTTAGGHPLVTESGTQTLTNKIISVDNNTVSGIAASSFVLSNASGNIDGAASQKVIPTGTVVGTSDTQTLSNKTLTSALVTSTLSDNTATLAIADARFVKGQIAADSGAKGMSQGVELTYDASGSTGISVADNSNIDFGTRNFTLHWEGSIPDWSPTISTYFIFKREGSSPNFIGYLFSIHTDGKLRIQLGRNDIGGDFFSTDTIGLVDGTNHKITAVVTRETASAAGSVIFYVDGVQFGSAVAITAAATVSIDNTSTVYVAGLSTLRNAAVNKSVVAFNRALTAAEVLDLHRNGVSYADKWGSQTLLNVSSMVNGDFDSASGLSSTGGTFTKSTAGTKHCGTADEIAIEQGKNYWCEFDLSVTGNITGSNVFLKHAINGSNYSQVLAAVPGKNTVLFLATGTTVGVVDFAVTDVNGTSGNLVVSNLRVVRAGATLALEPEGITVANWHDSSANGLNASYPASGSSLTRHPYGTLPDTMTNKTIVVSSNTITTAASGSLAATELNAALAELDSDITAHLNDTTDAHDASAISVADAGGYFTATDVEGVLQELGSSTVNYFTEARNTTAPNATIPVHSFTALGAETNIDAAFSPKGTGALSAHVADNAATGGNKRGSYAVDFQQTRNTAAQVASGEASVNAGGFSNTSSGRHSVSGGGSLNVVDGEKSTIPGGAYGTTRGLYGRYSYASGIFASNGDAQLGIHIQRLVTTNATASIVTADGAAVSSTNVSVLPDNHAYTAIAYITARDTSTGDMASFKIEGSVKRGANAAATALVGTPTVTTIAADAGASTWAVALVANTTRGSVEVQVTGEAATTIHWVCKLDTVEVG